MTPLMSASNIDSRGFYGLYGGRPPGGWIVPSLCLVIPSIRAYGAPWFADVWKVTKLRVHVREADPRGRRLAAFRVSDGVEVGKSHYSAARLHMVGDRAKVEAWLASLKDEEAFIDRKTAVKRMDVHLLSRAQIDAIHAIINPEWRVARSLASHPFSLDHDLIMKCKWCGTTKEAVREAATKSAADDAGWCPGRKPGEEESDHDA